MTGHARRSARIRNLPILFMVWAVLSALYAICMPFAANADFAKENELQTISGSVERAPHITTGKGGNKVNILIHGSDGLHHLTQENMNGLVPGIMDGIMNLRVGDKVTARVRHDSLGRDLDWFFAIQRNGITLLSYHETEVYFEREIVRVRRLSQWAAGLALVFLVAAIILRKKFGAWGNSTPASLENQRQAH